MAFQRRRHRLMLVVPNKPSIFIASFVLVFLACLSFFVYHPDVDSPAETFHRIRDRTRRSYRDPVLKRSPGNEEETSEVRLGVTHNVIFHVPNEGGKSKLDLWNSKLSKYYYGCCNASIKFPAAQIVTHPNRYLMIATSGGLNQQRTGIIDAVVAARILNATLVVPKLDQRSFWKDSSDFSEIFDVDWFISSLSRDVKIIKQLPTRGGKVIRGPYTMRVPRKCNPRCYHTRVLPVILKKHVVQLAKFDYRLSNRLETDLQKLRCRVNYHALRFTDPIKNMGETLVRRMRAKSKHFIALHLRFEPDMLAFSGCYYGGGDKERRELGAIRHRWKTLHKNNPDKERRQGKCPLTPEEVGLMLRALGFGMDVHIYVASGEVYGSEGTLAPLKEMFPNYHSKETLAKKEELAPFSPFSSRMAALDFIVCDGSDAFVTNNNGNMAKIIAGRRRYYEHKRTIRPNSKKLYSLFLSRANLTWDTFAAKVRKHQRGHLGEPNEVRPGRGEFHENPATCICENTEEKLRAATISNHGFSKERGFSDKIDTGPDNEWEDDEEEPNEPDSVDEENALLSQDMTGEAESDDEPALVPDDLELEEMLSD